ncbi:MAG: hypothetical protein PHP17_04430 [Candidatus Omnitrophica bacterium]|nr:hypothetical protein [Candidatus Omnitrophota bacterium]
MGTLFPFIADAEKIIGRMGQIQGEAIVTNPAAKAKNNNIGIKPILHY